MKKQPTDRQLTMRAHAIFDGSTRVRLIEQWQPDLATTLRDLLALAFMLGYRAGAAEEADRGN